MRAQSFSVRIFRVSTFGRVELCDYFFQGFRFYGTNQFGKSFQVADCADDLVALHHPGNNFHHFFAGPKSAFDEFKNSFVVQQLQNGIRVLHGVDTLFGRRLQLLQLLIEFLLHVSRSVFMRNRFGHTK